MTSNPTPRPALRKAEDAQVHPAAPRPARAARTSRAVAPATSDAASAQPAAATPAAPKPARTRAFRGATSDHLRVTDESTPQPVRRTRGASRSTTPATTKPPITGDGAPDAGDSQTGTKAAAGDSVAPTTTKVSLPKGKGRKGSSGSSLMGGKSVELDVAVPKALRKAAKVAAKKRGLDLDTVVIDLLHAWVTDSD